MRENKATLSPKRGEGGEEKPMPNEVKVGRKFRSMATACHHRLSWSSQRIGAKFEG